MVKGPDGKIVGSRLIAQPFTKDEYFQPRPSAPSYDASASASSSLAALNYALRDRVAHTLGPIVAYRKRSEGGPARRARHRGLVQRGQVPGQARHRCPVGGPAQRLGPRLGQGRPDARRLRGRMGEEAPGPRGEVGQGEPRHAEAAGSGPGRRILRELLEGQPGQVPRARDAQGAGRQGRDDDRAGQARAPISRRPSSTCGCRSILTPSSRTCPATS